MVLHIWAHGVLIDRHQVRVRLTLRRLPTELNDRATDSGLVESGHRVGKPGGPP